MTYCSHLHCWQTTPCAVHGGASGGIRTGLDWANAWTAVAAGDVKWKDGESRGTHEHVYSQLVDQGALKEPGSIFVPLCGDGRFLSYAYSKGNTVTGCDITPLAIERLKSQFADSSFTETEAPNNGGMEYESERVRLVCGDILKMRPTKVDLIYDKDAFGAIPVSMRDAYLEKMTEFCHAGTHVFLEVKFKQTDQESGPPYHFLRADAEKYWCSKGFEVLSYNPSVYPLSRPELTQQGFLFRFL